MTTNDPAPFDPDAAERQSAAEAFAEYLDEVDETLETRVTGDDVKARLRKLMRAVRPEAPSEQPCLDADMVSPQQLIRRLREVQDDGASSMWAIDKHSAQALRWITRIQAERIMADACARAERHEDQALAKAVQIVKDANAKATALLDDAARRGDEILTSAVEMAQRRAAEILESARADAAKIKADVGDGAERPAYEPTRFTYDLVDAVVFSTVGASALQRRCWYVHHRSDSLPQPAELLHDVEPVQVKVVNVLSDEWPSGADPQVASAARVKDFKWLPSRTTRMNISRATEDPAPGLTSIFRIVMIAELTEPGPELAETSQCKRVLMLPAEERALPDHSWEASQPTAQPPCCRHEPKEMCEVSPPTSPG